MLKPLIISTLLISTSTFASTNTIDISTDITNSSNWTFTDGISSITPNFNSTSSSYSNAYASGWWSGTYTFDVGTLASSTQTININNLWADDRVVLLLNGNIIDSNGIYNYGNSSGSFQMSRDGALQSLVYGSATGSINLTGSYLTSGVNTLQLIVNDTWNGIYGPTYNNAGPTAVGLLGNITVAAVPEPEEWMLMSTGLLSCLGMARRKKIKTKTQSISIA